MAFENAESGRLTVCRVGLQGEQPMIELFATLAFGIGIGGYVGHKTGERSSTRAQRRGFYQACVASSDPADGQSDTSLTGADRRVDGSVPIEQD